MKKVWYSLALLSLFTLVISLSSVNRAESQKSTPVEGLPTVGTVEKLRSILAEAERSRPLVTFGMAMDGANGATMRNGLEKSAVPSSVPQASTTQSFSAEGSSDHSTTNLQVDGVDEGDIIKNDDHYIYQVNNQELIVAQIFPSDSMTVLSRIAFKEGEFTPQELYVDDKYLVVIGSAYYAINPPPGDIQPIKPEPSAIQQKLRDQALIYPPIYNKLTTRAIIYDIEDKTNLKKIREVELDGNYVSSRKIGSNLYLIANKYLDTYHIMQQESDPPQPSYRDTVSKEEFVKIDYNDIHYFPNFLEPNYLLIAGLDLDLKDKEMQVESYLGSSQTVYASASNLYIAVTQHQPIEQPVPMPQPTPDPASSSSSSSLTPPDQIYPRPYKTTTALYKFGLDKGETTYKTKGEVPGTILNQFAMDEHNGLFRIATTTGEIWRTDSFTTKNNVYIMDEDLQLSGKIEDIAPGEKIYSVRFMGDRGYMVTFKNVDPFFVIDLKDPTSPLILGALKIPGFSDYLHPYDENHIIGFGKETIELSQNGVTNAYYQGLKLAVFDVTDVSHPVEMFKTIVGDRGTDSEVLRNHKSLLFNKEKGILSFPVTLMEVNYPVSNSKSGLLDYGQFMFQGAYVYQFDLIKGFSLRGKITHLKNSDLLKAGQHYQNASNTVERIIYIKDTLYTVSKAMIKANDLESLVERNSLGLNP